MNRAVLFLFAMLLSFMMGAWFWRVKNKAQDALWKDDTRVDDMDLLATVGDEEIRWKDIEFEKYVLLQNNEDFDEGDLEVLKRGILHASIQRKILYRYLLKDMAFDAQNESRFIMCTKLWERSKSHLNLSKKDMGLLKSRMCEQSIIEQYCNERVYKKLVLKEEELLSYYESHRGDFIREEQIQIRQILLSSEEKAKWVYSQLTRENFSEMAQSHSISPEAPKGGLISILSIEEMPKVFENVLTLPIGQPKGIFKSTYGFHLFIVDQRNGPRTQPYIEAKNRIQKILLKEKQVQEFQDWVELATQNIPTRILRSF